jgi:hypothetical protein
MKKSDEQLELEKFWKDVYVAALSSTRSNLPPVECADKAVDQYKKRFPPAITPTTDKTPD